MMGKSNATREQARKHTEEPGAGTRTRRAFLKRAPAVAAAAVAMPAVAGAQTPADKPAKKVFYRNGKPPATPPLFNGTVLYGNLVFISGIGYHEAGDITVHTTKVL